ncbi:MAG: hypothetical protein NZ750_08775 [Anaerolineae bacterium]|nr:hypothetical protein [Anaerolineae bacterium]MDW8172463.1 hypothetical protein [Anaerolineae bacterium]
MRPFVLLLILLLVRPTLAQAPGSTPEQPPYRVLVRADLAFPAALALELGIEWPADRIVSAELLVRADGLDDVIFRYPNPRPWDEATAAFAVARLVWTPLELPPLFSIITYSWRVVDDQGRLSSGAGEIAFQDERFAWIGAGDELLSLHAAQSDPVLTARSLYLSLRPMYEQMARRTGQSPRFRFLVYSADIPPFCARDERGQPFTSASNGPKTLTWPCDLQAIEAALRVQGYELLFYETLPILQERALSRFFSAFYEPLWSSSPPAWFAAGLRAFYRPGGNSAALTRMRARLRTQTPYSLEQMSRVSDETAWQDQAQGMVLYIAELGGVEALFELARQAGRSNFSERYAQIIGQDLASLLPSWQSWLYTSRAELVYGYTPYVAETPTLTPSFTPRPPTRTPSSTPTQPSATPSPVVTASRTPSRTPRPPTATLTPLPPQAFVVRATPAPTQANQGGFPSNARTFIGIAAIVVAALAASLGLLIVLFKRTNPS